MLIWGIAAACIAGLLVKFAIAGLRTRRDGMSLTWPEFAVGLLLCAAVVVPATVHVGAKVAVNNQLGGFREYWNGYETRAVKTVQRCERDGACRREYSCDSYVVMVQRSRRVASGTDAKGNTVYRTEYYQEPETRWHQCPYTTEEWTFTVETTLGTHTVASAVLPQNPDEMRFRPYDGRPRGIPGDLRAAAGAPAAWTSAQARLAESRPGGVTEVHEYDNYILASQRRNAKTYEQSTARYLKAGLLPKPASGVTGIYRADKVYAVGAPLAGEQEFQDAVMRFNGAFGSLQGDLHLVVVNSSQVNDSAEYAGALLNYWQGKSLGKDALSKNAFVLILGTDGRNVTWARAKTGMPTGNEALLTQLSEHLPGVPLDARALLGSVRLGDGAETRAGKEGGAVGGLVFGRHRFQRQCMVCKEEGGAGYVALKDEITPTGTQKALITLAAGLLSVLIWLGIAAVNDRFSERLTGRLRQS